MNKFLIFFLIVFFSFNVVADVKLPYTFAKGMILQHGKPHPIWGMADPGEKVTVEFAGQKVETVADDAGEWEVILEPLQPSEQPQEMIISGTNKIKLNNIIVGEVWLSIGTGIMGKNNLKVPKGEQEKLYDTAVRCHMMPNANAILPVNQNFIPCMWVDADKKRFNSWAEIPFYFMQNLREQRKIPVGLLNGAFARGGDVEMYIPYCGHKYLKDKKFKKITAQMAENDISCEIGYKNYEEKIRAIGEWLKQSEEAMKNGEYPPERPAFSGEKDVASYPSTIYNIMVHPVKRFPVSGLVIYLEKTYAAKPEDYFFKLGAMIDAVREDFKRPDLPVIIVNPIDSSGGDGVKIAESRNKVKMVFGVGKGGLNDILPGADVGKAISEAAVELTQ